jgi:hypothetical protein
MLVVALTLLWVFYATIPDYGKKSVKDFINYKYPNAVFAETEVMCYAGFMLNEELLLKSN